MNGRRIFIMAVLSILTFLPTYSHSAPATKLLIAMGQEPNTMDPSACWAGSADYQVSENYAEYLIDSEPSGELKPGLATASEDNNQEEGCDKGSHHNNHLRHVSESYLQTG